MRRLTIGGAMFLLVAGLALWFADSRGLLPGYAEIRTRMGDASGLTDGTKVRLNGIIIGYLDQQQLTGSRDPRQKVQFVLKVRSKFLPNIPIDSRVGVAAENLVGDKAISIIRGTSKEHIASGAELRSVPPLDPNSLMAEMGNEMQGFQDVVNHANNILNGVDAGNGSIGKMIKFGAKDFAGVTAQAEALKKDLANAHGTFDKMFVNNDELSMEVDATQKRFNELMAAFQSEQGPSGQIKNLQKDFDHAMEDVDHLKAAAKLRGEDARNIQARVDLLNDKLRGIMQQASSGSGSLGHFQSNPTLSEALTGTSTELQAMMRTLKTNPRKFFSVHVSLF
jgi:phospholipid/cholesterol/gamma-HCH transport system substrate-binding protein